MLITRQSSILVALTATFVLMALPAGVPDWHRKTLADPQISGGQRVACDAASASRVPQIFAQQGFRDAREIGTFYIGIAEVIVS